MPKTGIDYFKFRAKNNHFEVLEAVRPHFHGGDLLEFGPEYPGRDGWKFCRHLMLADIFIAWVDYGGESQRGWLRFDMPGNGCEWVSSWQGMYELLTVLNEPAIRRVDVKLDLFDGSVTHESVLHAHENLEFKRLEGGRNPKLKKVETSAPEDGRTVYIGARESARFIRCYEKGWEMLSKIKLPEQFKKPDLMVDFEDGHGPTRVADRYRIEVEFKPVKGVVVPWPILIDPDAYFAGAAPFCQKLVNVAPRRAQAVPSALMPRAVLATSMEHCRAAYGGLLRTLLELYGDSPEVKARLFDELASNKPSERLIKEGVLTLTV
jgi:DNA relaxase NicK